MQRSPHQPRRRLRRMLCLAVIVATAISACGSATPTPKPTQTAPNQATAAPSGTAAASPGPSGEAAIYEQIESQVEGIRDLQPKKQLVPTLLDEATVRDFATKGLDTPAHAADLALTEAIYKHLGLLPASASLRQLEIDIQSSQIIGLYDTVTKQLYLVSGTGHVGALQKATFSHEFTHALQDQNFDLRPFENAPDQTDRDLARLSVEEGDAVLVMQDWAQKGLSLLDLAEIVGQLDSPQQEQLSNAPAILQSTMMFPYLQGLAFVQHLYAEGGWSAVDKVYASPPDSTSQVMHPQLYDQHVEPVAVTLPATPSGWKLKGEDTVGEFQFGVWLAGDKATADKQAAARAAVDQWAGDRLGLYEGPAGKWSVVIRTSWRTDTGRTAFRQAASGAVHETGSTLQVCVVGTMVNVVVASDSWSADQFDCGRG